MLDCFGRNLNYLRISVTDKCNLACEYCAAQKCTNLVKHNDLLSFEEIAEVVNEAVLIGFEKFRITGGEPLVRPQIEKLVALISGIAGVKDLSMTSNGILLEDKAEKLAKAGLMRINISLDSVDKDEFFKLTGGGDLDKVVKGIRAAKKAGLFPIKLNCVVNQSKDEPRARKVKAFADAEGIDIRYIHRMDLEEGVFAPVEGGEGGKCYKCNRLRLNCMGKIVPCLFNDLSFDVREYGAKEALAKAVSSKPEHGTNSHHKFWEIGG
ncbi:MAG: GTP 3',8-cyclase MoaA [Alphaproteobacteria bacterium]